MAWRVADSLLELRDQVNAAAPNRSKRSDGTIGDAAHATRSSDHNPWVRDGATGIVTAIDLTHDPAGGADMRTISEALRRLGDPRRKYVIFNRRIASATSGWVWRAYTGSNPHTNHMHLSVQPTKSLYDSTRVWTIGSAGGQPQEDDVVRFGDSGEHVEQFQRLLNHFLALSDEAGWAWTKPALTVDGHFGPATREHYQHAIGRAQKYLESPSLIGGNLNSVSPTAVAMLQAAAAQLAAPPSSGERGPRGPEGPPGPGLTPDQVRDLVDGARIEGVVKLSG